MPKFYTRRSMNYVKEHWGKEDSAQNVTFQDTESFFASMIKPDDWILDDQTWNDLDMNQNYLKMNRTYSMPGQQILYNMLRILKFDEPELRRRNTLVEYFRMNPEQRQKVQCVLRYLGKEDYDSAAGLLYKKTPPLPKASAWVLPATFGMILSLVSIPFLQFRSILLIVIFFIMNMVVHNQMNRETEAAMPGIRYLVRMLLASQELARLNLPELSEYNDFFRKAVDKCKPLLKKSASLKITGGQDPFGLAVYLNIMFLIEARAYLRCISLLKDYAPVLRALYRRLGELDAFQSMASVKRALRHSCRPVFTEKKRYLRAEQIGYPLLAGAVCNDITLDGRNMVLTGSNMSGKSTFLRTLGVNAVLAQTFDMTFAKHYEASFFHVITSISPSDSLMEGRSYYMAEAKALLRMVYALDDDETSSLLLIDEIFRGTNPTERVAGASALLQYFSHHNCIVIVATHDTEITRQVEDQYDKYHFEETVTKDSLEFDYKLKTGELRRPNGIHILEYIGYPREITDQALELVREKLPEDP